MNGTSGRVFDTGLQAERTALAWRRTALAMAVSAVGAGRLAAPVLGPLALVVAGLGLLQAVVLAGASWRRYRTVHGSLVVHGTLAMVRGTGLRIATLAASGALVGLLALAFVLAEGVLA